MRQTQPEHQAGRRGDEGQIGDPVGAGFGSVDRVEDVDEGMEREEDARRKGRRPGPRIERQRSERPPATA